MIADAFRIDTNILDRKMTPFMVPAGETIKSIFSSPRRTFSNVRFNVDANACNVSFPLDSNLHVSNEEKRKISSDSWEDKKWIGRLCATQGSYQW